MEKVCAVVVTYNRRKLLEKNLQSLLNQNIKLDILVVDNNSNDDTEEKVKKLQEVHKNIIYLKLENNVGGAGGFYNGVKKSYELNYDFVILMDDDGRPMNDNTFKMLIETYNREEDKNVMINSLVYSEYDSKKLSFGLLGKNNIKDLQENIKDGKIENQINPFNGTLLSRKLIKDIGFPKKEFFISGDETEYSLRAKKHGYKLITSVDSEYYHPASNCKTKVILGRKMDIRPSPLWRIYYNSRNYSYISKKYNNKLKQITSALKLVIKAFILSDKPFLRTKYTVLGIIDGYKEKFDNNKHTQESLKEQC